MISGGLPSTSSLPVSESQNGNEGKESVGERVSKALSLRILTGRWSKTQVEVLNSLLRAFLSELLLKASRKDIRLSVLKFYGR